MRPLWERTTTWGIADHLRRQGLGTDAAAYNVAALIVRALDRHAGLAAEMARYTFIEPADVDDPGKTSPRYIAAMQQFWASVGTPAGAERNKLLEIAEASALRGGRWEATAAATLAQDARTIEAAFGPLGKVWAAGESGGEWSGFGALRDEMALTGNADVLAAYDRLAAAGRDRAAVVKQFQTWAKILEWYAGRVDGVWGPLTEAAFLRAVPMAAGRLAVLRDVIPLRGVFTEGTAAASDARSIGLLITRDLWLGSNPSKLAAEAPASPPPEGGGVVVSYPKAETATASLTPSGGSQIVVTYPKIEGPPETVAVNLPPPGEAATGGMSETTKDLLIGGGLALGSAVLLGAAWWLNRRKPPLTLTEDTP